MSEVMKILPFEMSMYDEVYAMWREIFPTTTDASYDKENIKRFLFRNPGTSFVAVLKGRVIGAVLAGNDGRRGYIHHLGVAEEYRIKGIGSSLLEAAEYALKSIGMEKVHLFVIKDNSNVKGFYEKTGYSERKNLDIFSKVI